LGGAVWSDAAECDTISFREGDSINTGALTTMLKQKVANNSAGGWRKPRAL